jgi:hypothetical protein
MQGDGSSISMDFLPNFHVEGKYSESFLVLALPRLGRTAALRVFLGLEPPDVRAVCIVGHTLQGK